MYWPVKDPADVLDYSIVFEDINPAVENLAFATFTIALQGAAGTTGTALISAVALGPGYASSFNIRTATIWLANGRAGESYLVSCLAGGDVAPGRIYERSVSITIANR